MLRQRSARVPENYVKKFATNLLAAAALFSTAMTLSAADTMRVAQARDAQPLTLALSVARVLRRVEPLEDTRFNRSAPVQFVDPTRFSQHDREKMRAYHDEFAAAINTAQPADAACPKTQRYVEGILDRLIDASSLRQAMQHADFPVHLAVTCGVVDHPDAEMKAGVLEVSAELILAMASEDEIAAMLGHELAHYTLAHGAKRLAVHARLTPYAARVMSVTHELEADAEGLILLTNAGYDPHAALDALKAIRTILHTHPLQSGAGHPDIDDRIRRLQQRISEAALIALPRRTRGLTHAQDELRQRPIALLQKREGVH